MSSTGGRPGLRHIKTSLPWAHLTHCLLSLECAPDQRLAFNGNSEAYSLREVQVSEAAAEGRSKHSKIDTSALVHKDHRRKYFLPPVDMLGF